MKSIPLNHGKVAVVDDRIFPVLSKLTWHAKEHHGKWYAEHTEYVRPGVTRSIKMHRMILPGQPRVDHKDGDGLNNQLSNLRAATNGQNRANSRKNKNCSSRYKGVTWYRRGARWMAQIVVNRCRKHLGYFTKESEAAKAYDSAAREAFGEFARVNFP